MAELEFSRRLRQYRRDKKLTQQELADQLGVSNKSVSRWESGSYPDVSLLGPLAAALGVTVDDLLGTRGPVRTLTKADWQSVLSFAFALGGGILFFALSTFTPALIAYLIYAAAMAYGIYLQRHYTYRSRWFHLSNMVMNFFVNFRIASLFQGLLTAWRYHIQVQSLQQDPSVLETLIFSTSSWNLPKQMIAAVVLTAITAAVIYLSGRHIALPKVYDPSETETAGDAGSGETPPASPPEDDSTPEHDGTK